ncbi:NAD(P)-binding protein [Lophiostoma macrostomum CBS 122681]|uniref:NAD(P)-binding protein n=1 Tax=Lophiostoma macrostomum CBS 122681 TaxID=1314788 RepID=A0A6A6T503_9PLEO|nr:NAD(P)-binding protein [Lophiostoma macrostomum CBS 122681]
MDTTHLSANALFNVKGMVAVVTGGGTGIGLMTTKALAANGASKVYIIGRRKEVLESAATSIDPSIVVPLPGDVTDLSSLSELSSHIASKTGYINLLVANAGIMGPRPLKPSPGAPPPSLSDYVAHALKTPMSEFTHTYEVNTTAVYYTTLSFLNLLSAGNEQGNVGPDWRSQVLATSSIGGFSRLAGASFAYNSSKAAVTHMMKMMATSLVPYKIRCNVLAPGIFPSDLAGGTIQNLGPGHGGVFDPSFVPAERAGTEEDIAGAVLFLASKAGAYLNGSVVVVDGGRLGMLTSTY